MVAGCKYKILDKNGKVTKSFSSELELNDFLKNSKVKNSYVFSASSKTNEATDKLIKTIKLAQSSNNKTTVTDFLTMEQLIDGTIKRLNPEYIKENRIENTIKNWIAENKVVLSDEDKLKGITVEEKAKSILNNIIEEEELMGNIGTDIHRLLSIMINSKKGSKYYAALNTIDYDKYDTAFNSKVSSNTVYEPKKIIDNIVTRIYNELQHYVEDG
jgi:hypothetical protein